MVSFDQGMDVAVMLAELTRRHTRREVVEVELASGTVVRQAHVVEAAPLLEQLETASPSASDAAGAMGLGYSSRPAAWLETIDALAAIERDVDAWLSGRGIPWPQRGESLLAAKVRHAGALHRALADSLAPVENCRKPAGRRGCCALHDLQHAIRSWWTTARVITGWDSPAWRPDAHCPACETRGSLRIRLSDRVGLCVQCQETWDPGTIGLLAEIIRVETAQERRAGRPGPCWCPLPQPAGDLAVLCPKCGSRRCHRAITALQLLVADIQAGARSSEVAARHGVARKTAVRLIRAVRYPDETTGVA